MRKTVTAATILALAVGLAAAQPQPKGGMTGGMMPKQMSMMPDMTADQMAKMDAERINYIQMVGPIMTDIAARTVELAALWRADNIDSKMITAKVGELSALKAKLDAAKANHMIAAWGILTPDQRKSLRMGMHGMMQRMMMPGMMSQGCPMMGGSMMGGDMMGSNMMGSEEMTESEPY